MAENLITGWTYRNLPGPYSIIRTSNGALYEVDESIPETREYGDTSRGFVMAYRLKENGKRVGVRRTRIYADQIIGKIGI